MFYLISGAWAKMGTFKMILWLAHANCQFSKMVDNIISGKITLQVFTKSAFCGYKIFYAVFHRKRSPTI